MFAPCGIKPAFEPPPVNRRDDNTTADFSGNPPADTRNSWVRNYLWELVRKRVRVAKYAWHWYEQWQMRLHLSYVNAEGVSLLVGQAAVADLNTQARANGLEVYAQTKDSLSSTMAAVEAEIRALQYRIADEDAAFDAEMHSDDDDMECAEEAYWREEAEEACVRMREDALVDTAPPGIEDALDVSA